MLKEIMQAVREVSEQEIMPRYQKVARQRKIDGSLFTEADVVSQEALGERLHAILPVPMMAEEMSLEAQESLWLEGQKGLWCVDPIDGTSNFANGLPYFAVSVALMVENRSVLGVIYNPVSKEMFCAEKGKGAFLNGEKLPFREGAKNLRQAIAGVDFKRISKKLAARLVESPPYSSQRNYGACSLEWCYAATGRFDVCLHGGQKPWDYAAGAHILEEAGGKLCCLNEDDFWEGDFWQRPAVCAINPELFEQWKNWIRAEP